LTSSLSYNWSFQLLKVGSVPSVSSGGFTTFTDYNNTNAVHWARVLKTVASLWVSNDLLLDIGVSLALSSSQSHLILVFTAASSSWGFKMVVVLPSEVFTGHAAALPAVVFLSIVVPLGNF